MKFAYNVHNNREGFISIFQLKNTNTCGEPRSLENTSIVLKNAIIT